MLFLQGPTVLLPLEKVLGVTVGFSGRSQGWMQGRARLQAVPYPTAVGELQPLHVPVCICAAGAFPPRPVS